MGTVNAKLQIDFYAAQKKYKNDIETICLLHRHGSGKLFPIIKILLMNIADILNKKKIN